MDISKFKIFIAIPLLDELDNVVPLIRNIEQQSYPDYKVFFCVNQPDLWWGVSDKLPVCQRNQETIRLLNQYARFDKTIINKSSKGLGWKGKKTGVGMARKTMMDQISVEADDKDIIISLDGDTHFGKEYFSSIAMNFRHHPDKVALSVPYYHPLSNDVELNRLILRYEIYLRYYALNLWRINSFYRFTAIGSAIALPVSSYRAIGGITPHKSGEDFYLLQKLRKFGEIQYWNEERVFPAARYSNRVDFGTGPAMIRGRSGNWESYPIFDHTFFDEVKKTQQSFANLFSESIKTPMDNFFQFVFKEEDIWEPLRRNFKTRHQFVKACHHKIDALRIFQFLKHRQAGTTFQDDVHLKKFLIAFYPKECPVEINSFSFSNSSLEELNMLRDFLVRKENVFLMQAYH